MNFQHDGATPHLAIVRNWLNKKLPALWIEWTHGSPDLSPQNVFLCGTLKDFVDNKKPQTTEAIGNGVQSINSELVLQVKDVSCSAFKSLELEMFEQ